MSFFLQAFAETIREELAKFPEEDRDDVVILFSAHSLPMKVNFLYISCISIIYSKGITTLNALGCVPKYLTDEKSTFDHSRNNFVSLDNEQLPDPLLTQISDMISMA